MNGGTGGTAANDYKTSDFATFKTRSIKWGNTSKGTQWFIYAPT